MKQTNHHFQSIINEMEMTKEKTESQTTNRLIIKK